MPPPVRREVFTLFEEGDSLLEAPGIIVAQSDGEIRQKNDIVVDRSTFRSQKGKEGKPKAEKAQGIKNEQEQARKQEDNE